MNEELLLRLKDKLPDLLDCYIVDPYDSDYKCVFCGNRSATNSDIVRHKEDCLGVQLQKALYV